MKPVYYLAYDDPLDEKNIIAEKYDTFEDALAVSDYTSRIFHYEGGDEVSVFTHNRVGLGSTRGYAFYSHREILRALDIPITDQPYEHIQSEE